MLDGRKFLDAGKRFAVGTILYAVGICFCVGTGVTYVAGAELIDMVKAKRENRKRREKYREYAERKYGRQDDYDENNDN